MLIMIVSVILKALFFYFIFLVGKNLWKSYKVFSQIKDGIKNQRPPMGDNSYNRAGSNKASSSSSKSNSKEDIEVEFRHID